MGGRPGHEVRPVVVLTRQRFIARMFDNPFTLRRERFQERIASLGQDRLDERCEAYRFAAGC